MASLLASGLSSQAAQVNWGCDRMAENQTSSGFGSSLGSEFAFELGAFEPGFIPTPENRDEWLDHWHSAQSSVYNERLRFFAGSVVIEEIDTEGVFVPTNQAYIWGYDSRDLDGPVEWILITNPMWNWPAGQGIRTPAHWSVGDASEAVVGEINAADNAFHIRTASLGNLPEQSSADAWREAQFADYIDNPDVSGWDADPDRDRISNLVEYALGLSPTTHDAVTPSRVGFENGYLTLTVNRIRRDDVVYRVEVSSDMRQWESAADQVEILEDEMDRLVARDRLSSSAALQRFMRLRLELTP